jgi:hypothetical protein
VKILADNLKMKVPKIKFSQEEEEEEKKSNEELNQIEDLYAS